MSLPYPMISPVPLPPLRMVFCKSPWVIGCEDLMQGDLVAYGSLGNKDLGGFALQIQFLWILHTRFALSIK